MTDQTSPEDAGGAEDSRPVSAEDSGPVSAEDPGPVSAEDRVADAQAAIDEARRRLAEAPAEIVVVNHVMGLYELAAIHLSAPAPDLRAAALAIDAVACLVDGLGDRLGAEAQTMRDALGNIRLAFVQVKARSTADKQEPPQPHDE